MAVSDPSSVRALFSFVDWIRWSDETYRTGGLLNAQQDSEKGRRWTLIISKFRRFDQRFKAVSFLKALGPAVTALLLQLITFAITARGLGVEAFGAYTAILALTSVGVEMVGLGGADLLVRAVAHGGGQFPRYYGNMLALIGLSLPPVVVIGTLLAVFSLRSEIPVVDIILAIVGEVLIGRMAASLELTMVAHSQTTWASTVRSVTACVRLAAAFMYFKVMGRQELEGWILVVLCQAALLSAAYMGVGSRLYGRPVFTLMRRDLSDGAAFAVQKIANSAQSNLDRMILSSFATPYALGIYGAASRVLQLGLFPIQVATRLVYPKYFEHGRQGLGPTRRYAVSVLPIIGGVGVVSGVGIAVASFLVPSVLGKDFADASGVALRLALAMPLMALQYPAGDILSGTGRQKLRSIISLACSGLFGFLLAFGAWLDGQTGIVYAYLAGQMMVLVILWSAALIVRDPPSLRVGGQVQAAQE